VTERLLTARAVAAMLDVSPSTVLRWTRAGDLPAVRLPSGQIRYRAVELEKWLAGRSVSASGSEGRTRPEDAPQTISTC
jgi:excisionase family DNA binding protein